MLAWTPGFLAQIELADKLKREQERLEWCVRARRAVLGALDDGSPEAGDTTLTADERAALLARYHAELDRLVEIQLLLDQLAEGRFGRCDDCGQRTALDELFALSGMWSCPRCEAPDSSASIGAPGLTPTLV